MWGHELVAGVTLWGYRMGAMWKQSAYLIDWFDEERPAMTWLKKYLTDAADDRP